VKLRVLIVGGAVAALSTISLTANAAGPGTGTCTTDAGRPAPPADAQTLPDGGKVYATGDQTGGSIGIQGAHGWLDGSGGTTAQGGTIAGYQTESGLNGSLNVDASPQACVGIAGRTVTAP
jgi:hypothetical protein